MSVLIRVEDEPPRSRLDYFRHVVADTFVPFDLQIDADHDFRARILTGQVGTVHVAKVRAPRLKAFRTPKLIRVSDPELFKLEVPVRGHTVFAQGDREAVLGPGDFTLLDLSRPCQLADRGEEHGNVAVKFPHAALPLPHDELARLTAVPISGRDGLGAAISSLARHMARHLDDHDPSEGTRLATALMDLLVVALAERLDRSAALHPPPRAAVRSWRACRRSSIAGWRTPRSHRVRSPRRTTSRFGISTSCSRPSRRRWRAGSGSAGWSGAAGN
jgi:AraC-binding-like domain